MTAEYEKFKLLQKRFRDEYTDMLLELLLKGPIWVGRFFTLSRVIQDVISGPSSWQDSVSASETKQDSVDAGDGSGDLLARILSCLAGGLERVERDAYDLLNQTDPGVSTTLLADWERVLGLPEPCFQYETFLMSVEERQIQAHLKLFSAGQITSEQWYIDYAAGLGFGITIEENPVDTNPFICGVATCGVESVGGRGGYSNMTITIHTAESPIIVLQCILNKLKQAHTTITYIDAT